MILFDSNILIYSASKQYKDLRELIKKSEAACSIISKLEVLGYHKITAEQIKYNVEDFVNINDFKIINPIKKK